MERIFVDSNYFVALYNPQDSLHSQTVQVTILLKRENPRFVISNFIFLEAVTVLAQRAGKKAAEVAGEELLRNPNVEFIHVDEVLQQKSWEIFREVQEKDISFVDCSTIAVMQAEGISKLLTFDVKDFKNMQKQHRISLYPLKT